MTPHKQFTPPDTIEELFEILDCQDWSDALSGEELERIWDAYTFTRDCLAERTMASGMPYIMQPISIAAILARYHLDAEAIAAAILQSAVSLDTVPLDRIKKQFGPDIAQLVDDVVKLSHYSRQREDLENLRKLFLSVISDVRVALIKLAERLQVMRTLHMHEKAFIEETARETLDIYTPLAERLGIWAIRAELEDLSFRYLDNETYAQIASELQRVRAEHEDILGSIIERVHTRLGEGGLRVDDFTITGRPKNIYSIYKKMRTPKYEGKGVERIYDKLGVRVIVNTIPECYTVLGIIHSEWPPVPGEFDDYIGMPLPSGYQSLHTAVRYGPQKHEIVEFQIRTQEMHYEAEYGIAAHWLYKEDSSQRDLSLEKKIAWLRRMLEEPQQSEDAETFIEALQSEVFQDRVYVFTPKGNIIDLPYGSTPIDFAYYIHTDVGNRCRGAKINGNIVTLNYQLKDGDQVEILTSKRGGPSRDWLNPYLGYVKTARARSKIRAWFRKLDREENVRQGREMIDREMRRLGLRENLEKLASQENYDRVDDFLAAIGCGDLSPHSIAARILEAQRVEETAQSIGVEAEVAAFQSRLENEAEADIGDNISVRGVSGLMLRMAGCCSPVPGEDILGYVTRGHGITVHRRTCSNILSKVDRERVIDLDWGNGSSKVFPVSLRILALDREGLLRDIVDVVSNEKVNMRSVNAVTNKEENSAVITAVLEVGDATQLSRILSRITRLPNVYEAHRATN